VTELASTMTPGEVASRAAHAIAVLNELTHGGGELSNPGDVRGAAFINSTYTSTNINQIRIKRSGGADGAPRRRPETPRGGWRE